MKTTISVTYSVSCCAHSEFDGEHTETFDLSDLTEDDCEQYMLQTLVIKRQGELRAKNADTKVKLGTFKVSKPGKRISTTPQNAMLKLWLKLTPAQQSTLPPEVQDAMLALEDRTN